MYFLDTNALYWYIGRENLGEHSNASVDSVYLRQFLDNRNDKLLASSAYIEAMVKYRNMPEYACRIHNFMIQKDLQLFNNVQYLTFSVEQMAYNLKLKGKQLSDYIKTEVLPLKIDIEVRFAVGFLMSIVLLYTKCCIDDSRKICPNHDYDIELFIKDKMVEKTESILRATLEEAYNNHENLEQQIFKGKYIELLEEGCQLADAVVEILSTKDVNLTPSDIIEVEEKIRNNYLTLKEEKPDNYLMENISKKLCARQVFKEEAKKRISEMYSSKGIAFKGKEKFAFKDIQIEYLAEELFYSWIDNSQKFRKNDIFDFFFLACADYKDQRPTDNILIDNSTYLLTFDKKIACYIERKRPSNGIVLRRFYKDC